MAREMLFMSLKIVSIVGARPQFIKAATVSRLLRNDATFREIMIHTGQHYDANMSPIFFDELDLHEPEYNLGIGSATHGRQTGEMLIALEQVLLAEKPDWVLIYGDTNSTLAGALVAAKLHIPIAHVEAGLRSFNRRMPEEINRVVADSLAQLLFAPTSAAVTNLQLEGVSGHSIRQVGDVMYDASLYYGKKAEAHSQILQTLKLCEKEYILSTFHRQENTDDLQCLTTIVKALQIIAKEIPVVVPLHPRTHKMLIQFGLLEQCIKNLCIIEPVGFLDMMLLEQKALAIVTDSGGVQKEAYFYQVPCVTLRTETEWVELVEMGWNSLAPPQEVEIVCNKILSATKLKNQKVNQQPYGDGRAAEKIVKELYNNNMM